MSEKRRVAIMGGSEDGKTSLAIGLSRGWWNREGYRSIPFDPFYWENDWGKQALVVSNFEKWRGIVDKLRPAQKIIPIWDEATDNGGRDRDNTGLLTAIRHNADHFIFIGHGYATMLPTMRGSLTDLLLPVRDPDEAMEWAKLFVDRDICRAGEAPPPRGNGLKQYQFLHKRKHHPVKILSYTMAQLNAGISL